MFISFNGDHTYYKIDTVHPGIRHLEQTTETSYDTDDIQVDLLQPIEVFTCLRLDTES
jgi:hypothetical protein